MKTNSSLFGVLLPFFLLGLTSSMTGLTAAPHAHTESPIMLKLFVDLNKTSETEVAKRTALLESAEKQIRSEGSPSNQELAEHLMTLGHAHLNYIPHTDKTVFKKPVALFREITGMTNVTHFRKLDATRMLGQTLVFNSKDPKGAAPVYQQMIALADSTNNRAFRADYLTDAFAKGAFAEKKQGNFSNSVALRDRLLAHPEIPESEKAQALLENGRDSLKMGHHEKAVGYYSNLFGQFPAYGKSNNTIVSIRFEQINAYGYDEKDPRRHALIEALWNDPQFASDPRIYSVGTHAAAFYKGVNSTNYISGLSDLIARLDSNFNTYNTETINHFGLHAIYQQSLLALADEYAKLNQSTNAISGYEKYLKLFAAGPAAGYAKENIAHAKRDIKRQMARANMPRQALLGLLLLIVFIPAGVLYFLKIQRSAPCPAT